MSLSADGLQDLNDLNRRAFVQRGSFAAMLAALGAVELRAQAQAPAEKKAAFTVNVAVIGLGPWGREIVNTLARTKEAKIVAICDTYPAMLKRTAENAPGAAQESDYKKVLADKNVQAVVIATPTHQHKQLVSEALAAGKHVYCEAPLAHTIEDARAIAAAAKAAPTSVFQAGLQLRSDAQRHFLLQFIRSGALGKNIFSRAQWHKKQSWRKSSPNPDREREPTSAVYRPRKRPEAARDGDSHLANHHRTISVWRPALPVRSAVTRMAAHRLDAKPSNRAEPEDGSIRRQREPHHPVVS